MTERKIATKSEYNIALQVRKNLLDEIQEYRKIEKVLSRDEIHAPSVGSYINDLMGMLEGLDRKIEAYIGHPEVRTEKPLTFEDALKQRERRHRPPRMGADVIQAVMSGSN